MASIATAVPACSALFRALGTRLRNAWASRNRSLLPAAATPSVLLAVVVAVLLCGTTALSSVVVFFLPLLVSTSICCGAVYLLVAPEGGGEAVVPAKEVVLMRGDGDGDNQVEVGLLQLYGGANASAYGGRRDVQVSCFLRRGGWTERGVDEDGEDVVFAGRLLSDAGGQDVDGAALEEELVALQVDRLAECVWESYFGGYSTWNDAT